ncbi:MAG TPA: ribosome small subunit-dependent GTPase A [Bacillota bacterium]|nr:ribosome small subunit-dependent GTPase A [Bacillota bacterium]
MAKAWSDWYDVETPIGRLRCQPRGRLRLTWQVKQGPRAKLTEGERALNAILVGDEVHVRLRPDGEGAIEAILPRRSALSRPLIANVDRVLVIATWTSPPWNGELVDRLLILAAAHGCEGWLVLNKVDELDDPEADARLQVYADAGYRVWRVSAACGDGMDELGAALSEGVSVLAGASGAGKSRLLGALVPDRAASLRTGEVSPRLLRGRHTTRHVELLRVPAGGFVADTPGFSRVDLTHIEKADLGAFFPEFAALSPTCRFRGCLHRGEPGCAVAGAVDPERLRHYRLFLTEVEAWEANRY